MKFHYEAARMGAQGIQLPPDEHGRVEPAGKKGTRKAGFEVGPVNEGWLLEFRSRFIAHHYFCLGHTE
jgi:hypothetical protein